MASVSSSQNGIILRLRHKGGTWRLRDVDLHTSIAELKQRIEKEYRISQQSQTICRSAGGDPMADTITLTDLNARNGEMLFLDYPGETPFIPPTEGAKTVTRKINADGTIAKLSHSEANKNREYRPGVPALRDVQRHWNWMEFMDLQKSLEFEVKRQETAICTKATIDTDAANDFASYLQSVAFQQSRIGFLYGRYASDKSIKVAAIYEPPQTASVDDTALHQDDNEEHVNTVANLLGLDQVGWIFSHPPGRGDEYQFNSVELLRAAELQSQYGGDSSFTTIKVTANDEGQASTEAFQISKQGIEMFEKGVLEECSEEPKKVAINPKFSVLVEKKEVKTVDTAFFLTLVPIAQYASGLSSSFPKRSRLGRPISKAEFSAYLVNCKARHKSIVEALADFNCLVYMASEPFLANAVPAVCDAILKGSNDLEEGFKLLICGFADVEY